MLVENEDDLVFVGSAADGAAALTLVREQRPDVIVMDVRMPGVDGIAALQAIAADPALAGTKVAQLAVIASQSGLAC